MRSEFVDANGIRFHYLTDGQGPLVVLLHGFPQLSYQYRHLVPALARAGYRAVAPDMRGFGDTTRPARIADYALQTLGEDVAALIDALGESKAHVLGHEWGAIVAAEAALSYPDKIDRLILVNGSPAITLGRAIHHSWRQRARSSYVLFYRIPLLPERWLTAFHGRAMRLLLSDAPLIKVDADRLRGKRIASTGLVLWGERDRILRRDLTRWIDRQFTHPTRKVFFPDVGHWVIEARPDEVAREVIAFIDEGRSRDEGPTASAVTVEG